MSNVTVTTSLTVLAEISVQSADVVTVHLKNTGAAALNAFQLRGKGGSDPVLGMVTLKSTDYTTPDLHCIYASAEPATLAAGAECILYLIPGYLDSIDLRASVASGTTTLAVSIERKED